MKKEFITKFCHVKMKSSFHFVINGHLFTNICNLGKQLLLCVSWNVFVFWTLLNRFYSSSYIVQVLFPLNFSIHISRDNLKFFLRNSVQVYLTVVLIICMLTKNVCSCNSLYNNLISQARHTFRQCLTEISS
jgi:hypothetical protein